jgi:hypothetical protein
MRWPWAVETRHPVCERARAEKYAVEGDLSDATQTIDFQGLVQLFWDRASVG